jgi:hypothetical protein
VSQVYLSFFVTASVGMDKTSIALVPLLLYLAQLSATLSLKPVVASLQKIQTLLRRPTEALCERVLLQAP